MMDVVQDVLRVAIPLGCKTRKSSLRRLLGKTACWERMIVKKDCQEGLENIEGRCFVKRLSQL